MARGPGAGLRAVSLIRIRMAISAQLASTDEPPYARNGIVIPLSGMRPITPPADHEDLDRERAGEADGEQLPERVAGGQRRTDASGISMAPPSPIWAWFSATAPTTTGVSLSCPARVSLLSTSRTSATMQVMLSGPPPRRASWISSWMVSCGPW
ncbi:hypothetical protein SBADM41S_03678 [Streptomyces badius]